jgi:hypothetical protein
MTVSVTNNRGERPTRSPGTTLGPELLERLLTYLTDRVSGCAGIAMSTAAPNPRPITSVGLAAELDELQWRMNTGPTVHASVHHEAISTDDLRTDPRWAGLAGEIAGRADVPSALAVMAVAGSWDDEGPIVLSLYFAHPPGPEDLRVIEEIEPVLAMSAALVEYCANEALRGDQLVAMVEHRRVIEQAKGMIMAVRRCDAGSAFRSLVASSQHFNVKLRDLAVATVELVGGAPAEDASAGLSKDGDPRLPPPAQEASVAAERMWAALRSA